MSIRKALGTVKDQTSISLAKVSSNISPELDVLVVKATSHDDEPAEERHVREILALTSYSLAHVGACTNKLSRRLAKTRDWVVAVKSLMLVHRLLTDGNPAFQREVLHATRRGTRLLNMSDFRDEAHSSSWDHSAFVRTYALYLDQRLECALYEAKRNRTQPATAAAAADRDALDDVRSSERRRYSDYDGDYDPYANGRRDEGGRYSYSSPPGAGGRRHDDDSYGGRERGGAEKKPQTPVRDMPAEQVLGRMHQLQQLLDRFLACRPTGRAKNTRMILVALYPVVRESFQIYADLCEILAAIIDRFFDLEYVDCVKAFEAYSSAAKQIDELVGFYAWCKETGVARSSEYPEVQRITDKLLDTLEEFMRDKAKRGKSPERAPREEVLVEAPVVADEEEPVPDMNGIKALPAPEGFEEKPPVEEKKLQETGDLLDLREDTSSADDQGNKLALALFSGPANGSWQPFSNGDSEVTSAWQTPAAEPGKADWELALVESASNLSKQKAALAGGFDPVLLDGMYDQGIVNQHVNSQVTGGSASSVALPLPQLGRGATPVLALPAPDGTVKTVGQDPFAASLSVPPPSYVQMAEIEKKQQLLVQEQQLWQHYARDGMQGQTSLSKLSVGYNHLPPAMPYGMPPLNAGGYYYTPYTGL